jgi:hypothetical protein
MGQPSSFIMASLSLFQFVWEMRSQDQMIVEPK